MLTLQLRTPAALLACVLLLYGCGPQITRPAPQAEPEAQAMAYLQQRDYPSAAAEFQRLAEAYPDQAASYRLRAVDAMLEGGQTDDAASLLDQLIIPAGNEELMQYRTILQAKIALNDGQSDRALALLPESLPTPWPAYMHRGRLQVQARAQEAQNDYLEAVKSRILLGPYLTADASGRNTDNIWSDLNKMDLEALQAAAAAGGTSELTGWLELALINKNLLFKPEQLQQAITDWQKQYPQHPAQPGITTRILAQARIVNFKPASVALLLPFTGAYQKASEAIREGFLSAWYSDADYRPKIRIYNADNLHIEQIYQQAVADGADLVVGPLEKSAIKTLAQSGDITVTTLALNRIDDVGRESVENGSGQQQARLLYQFALAPEDEVREVANRGIQKGFKRALIISPYNEWGNRLASDFQSDWVSQGGTVLDSVGYNPTASDFSDPVKRLLNIDGSEERIAHLRHVLSRNIVGSSRRRQDADLIYVVAVPQAGRQIVPQFRFFRIEQLPIYSTSHVYSGNPNPQLDADMDGVEFTDIPWVLRSRDDMPPIQIAMEDDWSSQTSPYRRLYAFGVDAFRLITQLGRLALRPDYIYAGQTGELSMSDDGRIHRHLSWARFVGGVPVPLKTAGSN